jgi:alpha-1,3-fucosyltransferase
LDGLFNWTVTYRTDSFINWTYSNGCDYRIKSATDLSGTNPIPAVRIRDWSNSDKSKKPKIHVAWMVSHCTTSSNREEYVRQFSKHINVDIYGKCGNLGTPASNNILLQYRFYLSFENSNCDEYVTEKLYKVLQMGIQAPIPIVMGAKRSWYETHLPPKSFIHVDDFKTMAELAIYLQYLVSYPDEYYMYQNWRHTHEQHCGLSMAETICQRLYQVEKSGEKSEIRDFPAFFQNRQCYENKFQ